MKIPLTSEEVPNVLEFTFGRASLLFVSLNPVISARVLQLGSAFIHFTRTLLVGLS